MYIHSYQYSLPVVRVVELMGAEVGGFPSLRMKKAWKVLTTEDLSPSGFHPVHSEPSTVLDIVGFQEISAE
jgi:hypothetical protein